MGPVPCALRTTTTVEKAIVWSKTRAQRAMRWMKQRAIARFALRLARLARDGARLEHEGRVRLAFAVPRPLRASIGRVVATKRLLQ